MDLDNNGEIDYNEFVVAACNKAVLLSETNIEMAFRRIDLTAEGYITPRNIQKTFGTNRSQSAKFWQELMESLKIADKDRITVNEFKQAMATLTMPVKINYGIMKRTSDFKISLKKMKKTSSASNSAASLSAHSGMHSARSASVNSALSKRNIVDNVESAF